MSDLARRALAMNQAFLSLGNERFQADGATFIRDRDLPGVGDANHVTHVTAASPGEIDRLLQRVEREYVAAKYRRFDLDFTTPPEFEARLVLEGYERHDALVMLLEGEPRAPAPQHEIRLVADDAGWYAHAALHEADNREFRERIGLPLDAKQAVDVARSWRRKTPPARWWLAYVDGMPRAYLASWEGTDGVGQVEDLFTHPDFRRRGLATALLLHGIDDCRRHGAGPVVIVADAEDTPKRLYASLGFRPFAVKREYWKNIG